MFWDYGRHLWKGNLILFEPSLPCHGIFFLNLMRKNCREVVVFGDGM